MLGFHYSDRTGSTYDTGHVALTDVTAWSLITADEAYEWLRFWGIPRSAVQEMDRVIARLTPAEPSTTVDGGDPRRIGVVQWGRRPVVSWARPGTGAVMASTGNWSGRGHRWVRWVRD